MERMKSEALVGGRCVLGSRKVDGRVRAPGEIRRRYGEMRGGTVDGRVRAPVAVAQLGTGARSLPRQLGPVNFELGIIAGTDGELSVMPGAPQETSDGTVSVAETIVPGMMDFLEMPVSHTFMMWNQAVLQQVIHFLNYGVFDREVLQVSAP